MPFSAPHPWKYASENIIQQKLKERTYQKILIYINEAQDLYSVAGPQVPSQIYIKTMQLKKKNI